MATEKKNQHYIPKFYLRNFSYTGNGNQIGVYNVNNRLFIPTAKLKTQGSKNFFYGYDGVVENHLSNIEGKLATLIKNIVNTQTLPVYGTDQYFELLLFATLTDLRNPVKIETLKKYLDEMRRRTLELDANADLDKLVPIPTHEEIVKMHIDGARDMVVMMLDLGVKLLVNKSAKPFITSDFPVIHYNQYLELKKWPHAKTGYGATGLQIFVPLNHEYQVLFYDKNIYKVGHNNKDFIEIANEKNIDDINILQFLNCFETIFFDERASQEYVKRLHYLSGKFKRANVTSSELSFLFKEGDEQNKKMFDAGMKNFMVLKKTDCSTNLQIDGVRIHSIGKKHKLHDSMAQLRPHAARYRNSY